jgi:hypothetical protein
LDVKKRTLFKKTLSLPRDTVYITHPIGLTNINNRYKTMHREGRRREMGEKREEEGETLNFGLDFYKPIDARVYSCDFRE